jgi:hypothetical protein
MERIFVFKGDITKLTYCHPGDDLMKVLGVILRAGN